MNMRVMIVDPQKNIVCGICSSGDTWIQRVNVHGVHGIYCLKCDTLTVFEPIASKNLYKQFQKEIDVIRETVLHK